MSIFHRGGGPVKRFAAILLSMVLPVGIVLADDGSWSTQYRLSEGSLYSQAENPDIALENELLVFDGFPEGSTRAYFFFRNASSRDVKVDAGFPARVRMGISEDAIPGTADKTGLFLSRDKYDKEMAGLPYAALALGGALRKADISDDAALEHSEYYVVDTQLPPRKEGDPSDALALFDFSVVQDGAPVPITSVVQEAAVIGGGTAGKSLELTFHFRHALTVKAGASSLVVVRYKGNYRSASENMGRTFQDEYSYNYILGTGRTWKGPIGNLYFALPHGLKPSLPKTFARMGRLRGKDVYLASTYKPAVTDEIDLTENIQPFALGADYFRTIWFDDPTVIAAPRAPAQDFVQVNGASSSLASTAPVYTADGVIPAASFGAMSLFDGVRGTAWSEGVAGDGIGEWVEFTLSKDVEAVDVQNGFNMSFIAISGKAIDTYYEKNNRPRTLEFVSSDGQTSRVLQLADTRDLQSFDRFFLSRGKWKMYIRAVYKGTRWQDTCLGELTFVLATPLSVQFANDEFLKAHEADIAGP
jgi:hypothetical protein